MWRRRTRVELMLPLNAIPTSKGILLACSSLLSNLLGFAKTFMEDTSEAASLGACAREEADAKRCAENGTKSCNNIRTKRSWECSEQCQQRQLLVVCLALALSPRGKAELRPQIYRKLTQTYNTPWAAPLGYQHPAPPGSRVWQIKPSWLFPLCCL